MEKLNLRMRRSSERGLIHDSRSDINTLMYVFNELHDKVNVLIDIIDKQDKRIEDLEKKAERNKRELEIRRAVYGTNND